MNEISFIGEAKKYETTKITVLKESQFINGIIKYLVSSKKRKRLLIFILNNNTNNFFAEILSSDNFLEWVNSQENDVFWCEPQIDKNNESKKSYEYHVSSSEQGSSNVWGKFSSVIDQDSIDFQSKFPLLACFYLDTTRELNNQSIKNAHIFRLKHPKGFQNVFEFKEMLAKLIASELFKNSVHENEIHKVVEDQEIIENFITTAKFDCIEDFLASLMDGLHISKYR